MKVNWLLIVTLLCVEIATVANAKNPFGSFVSHLRSRDSSNSNNERDGPSVGANEAPKGDKDDKKGSIEELENAIQARGLRELSNVRINSRDDVLTAAVNMVSSVSSALIYYYLIKSAIRSVRDLVFDVTKAAANNASTALPSGFETRYIPQNVTLNSYELDILGSSVVDPLEIDTDFEAIGGLDAVKQGLLDCCDLCLGLDLVGEVQWGNDGEVGVEEDNYDDEEEEHDSCEDGELVVNGNKTLEDDVVLQDEKINGTTSASDISRKNSRSGALSQRSATLLRPIQGVLLHGPPGCGKTALTRSLSKKCGLPMIQLSPSTLLRKWVGDTSQLTKAIFTLCHKLQPCILFIDEMDGLFRARREDDNAVDRQVKTEFMQLWDELGRRKDCRVLVVGATNRPQDLDAAIQRRFERAYLVGMPDQQARLAIIRKLLKGSDIQTVPHFDHAECARLTTGYSPSDIVNLLKAAACIPLRELQRARRRAGAKGDSGGAPTAPRALSLADVEEAAQSLGRPTSVSPSVPSNPDYAGNSGVGEGGGWQMATPRPSSDGGLGAGPGFDDGYTQQPLPHFQHSPGYDEYEYRDDATYSDDGEEDSDEDSDDAASGR